MGIFFKKYNVEFECDLTDGTSIKGKITGGGTIFTDFTDIQTEIRLMIYKNTRADIVRYTKYKCYEV